MRTTSVSRRATLLLCRFRFQITTSGDVENTSLAEECLPLAFSGVAKNAVWLDDAAVAALMRAEPAENMSAEQASKWIADVERELPLLAPHLADIQKQRAAHLLAEHRNARDASRTRNLRYRVQAQGEADILGIFIYFPVAQ